MGKKKSNRNTKPQNNQIKKKNDNNKKSKKNNIIKENALIGQDSINYILVHIKCDKEIPIHEIVSYLNDFIYGHTAIAFSIKPLNPHYTKKGLKFYIQAPKDIFSGFMSNYKIITQYQITCSIVKEVNEPQDVPVEWLDLMKECLTKRFSVNPVTNESSLDLSNFSNDTFLIDNGILIKICAKHRQKSIGDILKHQMQSLTNLYLNQNNLCSLQGFSEYFKSIKIQNVYLQQNKFANISELKVLHESNVKALDISENRFPKEYKALKQSVSNILPELEKLNGNAIEVVVVAKPITKPVILPPISKPDVNSINHQLSIDLWNKIDCRNEDELRCLYTEESALTFSSTFSGLNYMKSYDANLQRNHHCLDNKKCQGLSDILLFFKKLPQTKVLPDTIISDVKVFDSCYANLITVGLCILCGREKNESFYRVKSFHRSSIILMNGDNFEKIIQDFISFTPFEGTHPTIEPTITNLKEEHVLLRTNPDLRTLSKVDRDIVLQFQKFTGGMTVKACLEFLSQFPDPNTAGEQFTIMKANGQIPAAAYKQ